MPFNRGYLIRQVDLFTLKLFLSAVEEQQIGRAAIRENIAASTATKRIQDLEDIAGITLLERTPRGVAPTAAGIVLVRYLREIFGQIDNMRAEIDAFSEGMRGEVTIASVRSIIPPFLADEIGAFAREYPLVDLIVREVENPDVLQAVRHGEADIGVFVAGRGQDQRGLNVIPFRTDRMVAVVPRDHPLASRSSVDFASLLTENLIPVRAMVDAFRAAAERIGLEYRPKFTVKSGGVATSLVEAGLGVTVAPECLVNPHQLERVAVVELSEPWANRFVMIATAEGRMVNPATAALVDLLLGSADQREADPKQIRRRA